MRLDGLVRPRRRPGGPHGARQPRPRSRDRSALGADLDPLGQGAAAAPGEGAALGPRRAGQRPARVRDRVRLPLRPGDRRPDRAGAGRRPRGDPRHLAVPALGQRDGGRAGRLGARGSRLRSHAGLPPEGDGVPHPGGPARTGRPLRALDRLARPALFGARPGPRARADERAQPPALAAAGSEHVGRSLRPRSARDRLLRGRDDEHRAHGVGGARPSGSPGGAGPFRPRRVGQPPDDAVHDAHAGDPGQARLASLPGHPHLRLDPSQLHGRRARLAVSDRGRAGARPAAGALAGPRRPERPADLADGGRRPARVRADDRPRPAGRARAAELEAHARGPRDRALDELPAVLEPHGGLRPAREPRVGRRAASGLGRVRVAAVPERLR